ncbi:pseudouridine synthase [Brevibacterium luteolum]|uniref:RNA pseudouridylate synthase n=1 Tax=Brevibacterium luteolum TaxID=199591 RepID=A0A2N6PH88_9MICO|nr:pseudouridine synthase [Brevibacterium luteolum]MBM7529427.1 tRNA pseudouridine32 synthase/23S rRNA pseudouridine746 synthase [Brevibacterium luteolum]NNG80351.1 ribose-phosphate pyrophosphokinase [Brevibacterium luteolum]PMB98050.1 ribose-phosphate pyrophosphokinase [Brevibacterium luteolum]
MPRSPLPPREGITATRLRAPGGHETHALADAPVPASVGEMLAALVPDSTPEARAALVTEGRLCTAEAGPARLEDPVIPGAFYWFHRPVPPERRVPFEIGIVAEDEDLLVIDKPHFLASTPNGRFVRECAVTRLRVNRSEPDLVAIHRLDRVTAGLLVLSRRPETRGRYQRLFQDRTVTKTYRALAVLPPGFDPGTLPGERRTRLEKTAGDRQVREVDGEPNTHTRIRLAAVHEVTGTRQARTASGTGEERVRIGEFELQPVTGKTHQLRVHMHAIGLPILGDPVYPVDRNPDPYDFSSPLQLLASTLVFTDPLTGQERTFTTNLQLGSAAAWAQLGG